MAFLKKGPEALKELQIEVKTLEEWETLMSKKGLIVVDVYSAWCGPCKAIINTFKKLKNEMGDDMLSFATAESDSIDALADYRKKSQPTFLFYGAGQLVHAIHGCNGPQLIKYITKLMKEEIQIMEGTLERKTYVDSEVSKKPNSTEKTDQNKDLPTEEEEELESVSKGVTIAIIKPDAVKAGLTDDIIKEITDAGMEVLQKQERVLSLEEAAEFYKQHEGTDHFEQLIDFMSSGPCMTLVVSKPGNDVGNDVIPEFRNLIGPTDINVAKEEAPESLRAKYGTDTIHNAVHSCDTNENAARELAFFYPDFNRPVVQRKKTKHRLQRTLALIRPNALKKRRESIMKTIEDSGFLIAMQKEVQLSREQAEEFYSEHKGQDYFENLISNMTSGPSLALCLAREDAVQVWRDMLGPKVVEHKSAESIDTSSKMSLREKFSDPEDEINPLHGADDELQAEREMNILFPLQTTVAVIKPDAYEKENEREAIVNKIKEAGFKISAQKEVNLTKDLASWFYKEHEGKNFFHKLTDYMSSGPTQFLILSREDAVHGFRSLLGPTVPDQARDINPDCLRAQFAKDEMKNAVHGSSSISKVKEVINEFFPDIILDESGKLIENTSNACADAPAAQKEEAPNGTVEHAENDTGEKTQENNSSEKTQEKSDVEDQPNNDNTETSNVEKKDDSPENTVDNANAQDETKEPVDSTSNEKKDEETPAVDESLSATKESNVVETTNENDAQETTTNVSVITTQTTVTVSVTDTTQQNNEETPKDNPTD